MRGATEVGTRGIRLRRISIHAPHARSDSKSRVFSSARALFQSTLLMRGATEKVLAIFVVVRNFNPRSSCEERPFYYKDWTGKRRFQSTLLMRGATPSLSSVKGARIFQSTLLMRGATRPAHRRRVWTTYFNPRSSCEERPLRQSGDGHPLDISIHAPHARSDAACRSESGAC